MTNPNPDVAAVAERLSDVQRSIVKALCGNAWSGGGTMSPGIAIANGLGLMHIDMLKSTSGECRRYKAKPTELGTAVRSYLLSQEAGEGR